MSLPLPLHQRLGVTLGSLRMQIALAFAALILVFALTSLTTLDAFQRQIDYDRVVAVAARLELTAQQLHLQALNYKQNAPRDYPTYFRDVRLYWQDLSGQIALFDQVIDGFMVGDLSAAIGRPGAPRQATPADPRVTAAIRHLESVWQDYRQGLMAALGDDLEKPRLEWAAEHNIAAAAMLQTASAALTDSLRTWAEGEHRRMRGLTWTLIAAGSLLALGLLLLLHYRALRPLQRTMAGFQRVADGDFAHRVAVEGASEARTLAVRFNALAGRLDLLFRLSDALQRGQDLDQVVTLIAREFRGLLRFDWIGVVLANGDSSSVRLEASTLDGIPEPDAKTLFRLPGTLLEAALAQGHPLHIADLPTALARPRHEFLRAIASRGMQDVIFLPVGPSSESPVPGVIAFATRAPGRYDEAHLRFLNNIAALIGTSFGRTMRLAERGRLAAIGGFVSGIAHELRSPLTTIGLALEHLGRQPLADGARRRLDLASGEAARMERLIEDILLYARPLRLDLQVWSAVDLVRAAITLQQAQPPCTERQLRLSPPSADPPAQLLADRDRIMQILANLLRNACAAAPPEETVVIAIHHESRGGQITISVRNGGPSIPPAVLGRIGEPFVSGRPGGNGLGLAIVRRLVELHGGHLEVRSAPGAGTLVRVYLPAAEAD